MSSAPRKPLRVGLTMGDPQGVGPELLVKTIAAWKGDSFVPVALGDAGILSRAAKKFAPRLHIERIPADDLPFRFRRGVLPCISLSELPWEEVKSADPPGFRFGREVLRYLSVGIDLAKERELDALVTAPIAKTALSAAGVEATGHTEILAERSGVGARHAMMLAGPKLRVTLATVHVPLSKVPEVLSETLVERAADLTLEALTRYFGIKKPKIALAGLNPHAGEQGMLGTEEREWLAPLVARMRTEGLSIEGPLSPDTVFHRAYEGEFDAVVALYHDQGLIPLKLVHFHEGVNLTLGLPFVRTSPDHGTAFDIAWTGKARVDSFRAALEMAVRLARRGRAGK